MNGKGDLEMSLLGEEACDDGRMTSDLRIPTKSTLSLGVRRKEYSIGKVASTLRWILLITPLYQLFNFLQVDIGVAFLRTIYHCPHSSGETPAPRYSSDWSGSEYCYDKDETLNYAQSLQGKLQAVSSFITILATVFIAPYADTWGRKPLMLLALIGFTLSFVLFFLTRYMVPQSGGQIMAIFGAFSVNSIVNCYTPAAVAMVTDLSPKVDEVRVVFLSVYNISFSFGLFSALAVGYYVLTLDLYDYSVLFATMIVIGVSSVILAHFLLEETLPQRSRRSSSSPDTPKPKPASMCAAVGKGFSIIKADPFLTRFYLVNLLSSLGVWGALAVLASWAQAVLGYSQATAALGGLTIQFTLVLGE
jgi:MFS family permease